MPIFHCESDAGERDIEANDLLGAAGIVAADEAGFDSDSPCFDGWFFKVEGVEICANVVSVTSNFGGVVDVEREDTFESRKFDASGDLIL